MEVEVGSRTSGETISPEVDASSRSVSEVPPEEVAVMPATSASPVHSSPSSSASQPLVVANIFERQSSSGSAQDPLPRESTASTEAQATEGPASLDPTGTGAAANPLLLL